MLHRTGRSSRRPAVAMRALAAASALALAGPAAAAPACPQTSTPSAWSGLTLDTSTTKSGVVYDTGGARLQLESAAGAFKSTSLGIADQTVFASVADFDRDGWDDFVGSGEEYGFTRVYRNLTMTMPEPDWTDPNAVRTPRFEAVVELTAAVANNRRRPTAAGDFNGDGWPDIFRSSAIAGEAPTSSRLWLNAAANDGSGNPTFQPFYDPMAAGTTIDMMGKQSWAGTSLLALDYNGDRKLDLLTGAGDNNGEIRVFLNDCTLVMPVVVPADPKAMLPCATAPHFTFASTLITDMGFPPAASMPVFAYEDVDGDGERDLVASAPSCCAVATNRLRLWLGLSGGGLSATPQSIAFQGGATVVFVADFSGDGKPDLIAGTDNWNYNPDHGGDSWYWQHNGTATPYADAPVRLTSYNFPTFYDFDVGFVFNYDHDPSNTLDLMIADGNNTSAFYVQANRMVDQYVACGDVASGVIDLGTLVTSEMVVSAARIEPTAVTTAPHRGTITYYLSNEDPPNWVEATPCADNTAHRCASFPRPVGRQVRWKATLCAGNYNTESPYLTGIQASFDYTQAREHFRAGTVTHDGVAYLGGFRQPGERGRLFAIAAGAPQTYWDAATAIDAVADSARRIYTSNREGNVKLDFTTANAANAALQATLEVSDTTQAATLIDWVRSKRFGVGNVGIERSRLGSIETSTPTVMAAPPMPIWYVSAPPADRARHLAFQIAHANRPILVMFGSKDGMIHAIRTVPTAITTAPSGTEAWAFVPPKIASGMLADYTDSLTAGETRVASYPDGAPTVADYRRADGSFGTIAVVGSGNGGKSVVALDVTSTITTLGTVVGPTPLWTAVPGDAEAGQGLSKPSIARVLIGGQERYIAIAATGVADDNPSAPFTKGRVVAAYDVTNGTLLWKFQAQCAITTDIATFETDDVLEPDVPVDNTLNGFIDRAVFADACGYVYKVAPARDLGGGWNDNTSLGAIAVDPAGLSPATPVPQFALFSARATSGALGADSPIAGTLAVRADGTGRVAIFFGTGGLENHSIMERNEFYAIYADTGEIRSKMSGTCTSSKCEKFYGGAVVTRDQVIFSRTLDPEIGTSSCDPGSSKITAVDLTGGGSGTFTTDFTEDVASAVMGSLYGDNGAVYFATLSGDVSRVGTPVATTAGGDTATPPPVTAPGNDNTTVGTIGTTQPLTMLGWRQVY